MARATRIGVPALIALAGAIVIAAAPDANIVALGVLLVGVAGLVVLTGAIVRAGERSNDERIREERAREFFDEHGRWPD
jgi:hypothetical protein